MGILHIKANVLGHTQDDHISSFSWDSPILYLLIQCPFQLFLPLTLKRVLVWKEELHVTLLIKEIHKFLPIQAC